MKALFCAVAGFALTKKEDTKFGIALKIDVHFERGGKGEGGKGAPGVHLRKNGIVLNGQNVEFQSCNEYILH